MEARRIRGLPEDGETGQVPIFEEHDRASYCAEDPCGFRYQPELPE